jgi:hypothetical protein
MSLFSTKVARRRGWLVSRCRKPACEDGESEVMIGMERSAKQREWGVRKNAYETDADGTKIVDGNNGTCAGVKCVIGPMRGTGDVPVVDGSQVVAENQDAKMDRVKSW